MLCFWLSDRLLQHTVAASVYLPWPRFHKVQTRNNSLNLHQNGLFLINSMCSGIVHASVNNIRAWKLKMRNDGNHPVDCSDAPAASSTWRVSLWAHADVSLSPSTILIMSLPWPTLSFPFFFLLRRFLPRDLLQKGRPRVFHNLCLAAKGFATCAVLQRGAYTGPFDRVDRMDADPADLSKKTADT